MIGKIYRPNNIQVLHGQRGFSIVHKLKSNMGGFIEFEEKIYLDFDYKSKLEVMKIEFLGLGVPVDFEQNAFVNQPEVIHADNESGNKVVTYKIVDDEKEVLASTTITISSLRKLNRPNKILTERGNLKMYHLITSTSEPSKEDVAEVQLRLDVKNGEEVVKLVVTCNTPVDFKQIKDSRKARA